MTAASFGSDLRSPPRMPCRARFTASPGVWTSGSPASANIAQIRLAAPPSMSTAVRVLRASSASIRSIKAPMAAGSLSTAWLKSTRASRSMAQAQWTSLATSIPMKTSIPPSVAVHLHGTPPSPSSPYGAMDRAA
jgi:hypothetical protein